MNHTSLTFPADLKEALETMRVKTLKINPEKIEVLLVVRRTDLGTEVPPVLNGLALSLKEQV